MHLYPSVCWAKHHLSRQGGNLIFYHSKKEALRNLGVRNVGHLLAGIQVSSGHGHTHYVCRHHLGKIWCSTPVDLKQYPWEMETWQWHAASTRVAYLIVEAPNDSGRGQFFPRVL